MATTEEPSQQRQATKRERAFLGQLPDDFLRVEEDTRVSQQSTRLVFTIITLLSSDCGHDNNKINMYI